MNEPARTAALQPVVDLYDRMFERLKTAMAAPVADAALSARIAPFLAAEARLLDARAFEAWLALCDERCHFWIPIAPQDHPGRDQALVFDDRKRLYERVLHFSDWQAWAITAPEPVTVRQLGPVEAWEAGEEIIATAPITLLHVRRGEPVKLSGREVLSLSTDGEGFRITSKTLVLPELMLGTPHLGWII